MEPMNLGSPGGSPATGATSPYLPSFLMGEATEPSTPRNNTLSPNKGRNISFAVSPGAVSPTDFNRSAIGQKTLFSLQQYSNTSSYPGTPIQSHNASMTGPPTQGLFDSLNSERNQVETPIRGRPGTIQQQSMQYGNQMSNPYQMNPLINESYLANVPNSSFNTSRIASPSPVMNPVSFEYRNSSGNLLQCPPVPRYTEFWITVFGFPQSAVSMILSHFSQCGTIIDKVYPPQNGNWIHIKFSSRLECDKALNYNEKILGNNIMIGVTQCKDKSIIDKENLCDNTQNMPRVRPLSQVAFKSVENEIAVVPTPTGAQKSSGIMNKAMDLFFGW